MHLGFAQTYNSLKPILQLSGSRGLITQEIESLPVLIENNWYVNTSNQTNFAARQVTSAPTIFQPLQIRHSAIIQDELNGIDNNVYKVRGRYTWVSSTNRAGPSARKNHAIAYDSARGILVLFGGTDETGDLADTWEWDGRYWKDVTPSGASPSPRGSHTMVYDSSRGRVVLFGGSQTEYLNDTWEWDGAVWRNVTPQNQDDSSSVAPNPTGRYGHAMAYDSDQKKVVLFAGNTADAVLSDLWQWDGTSWTNITPQTESPPPRFGHAIVYDQREKQIILFGGDNLTENLSDTWIWDGSSWSNVNTGSRPMARHNHAMVYDRVEQHTLLFGGSFGQIDLSDVWIWRSGNWSRITSFAERPLGRSSHAMAYDSVQRKFILFGGTTIDQTYFSDTWEKHKYRGWYNITPGIENPSPRNQHAMAYDSNQRQVFLFGGVESATSEALSDTWVWDGLSWFSVPFVPESTPPPRFGHKTTYDESRQVVVLFGGTNTFQEVFSDTWEWDGSFWHFIETSSITPRARSHHAVAYDSTSQNVIMFGGLDEDQEPMADLWTWNGDQWTEIPPSATMPPARSHHAMAYDSARDKLVLYAGATPNSDLSDTWEWDPSTNTWTQINTSHSPPALVSHTMVYNAQRETIVLYGGDASAEISQIWEWDGTSWIDYTPRIGNPQSRTGQDMAYDIENNQIVVFGGHSDTDLADTWQLQNPSSPAIQVALAVPADISKESMTKLRVRAFCTSGPEYLPGTGVLHTWFHYLSRSSHSSRGIGLIDRTSTNPQRFIGPNNSMYFQCRQNGFFFTPSDIASVYMDYLEARIKYTSRPTMQD